MQFVCIDSVAVDSLLAIYKNNIYIVLFSADTSESRLIVDNLVLKLQGA